ncbi:MAG: hydroxymethylbilane synthase [Deltaproteobacteria bacterium]|nr:hydroxymethylbilane synthase [Deltaproteobacteria bacterium]MBW2359781.1 hydroxymethylbilane synthase [Deltaproteobacteria bacterium]
MSRVRLATRASDLALAQARMVAALVEERLGLEAELVPMKTTGDKLVGSLAKVGGKGLFVKEIEEALLEGRADLAVHSAKDLPARLPQSLELVAFPERADPRDALLCRKRGTRLADLVAGARVATGSLRRSAQLRALRPDLEIVPLRGNVPTRVRKLDAEPLDAIVLACAGLERLGLAQRIDERIAPEAVLPAVAQGIIAIEARRDDALAQDAAALGCEETRIRALAERRVLERLEADCNVPLAAFAELVDGTLQLRGLLADPRDATLLRVEHRGRPEDALALGDAVASELLEAGGRELLARLEGEAAP